MEEKVKFAISKDFLKAYFQIPEDIRKRMPRILNRIRKNPAAPEIHYEKLEKGADQKIRLLNLYESYWAVVVTEMETDTCIVLWADTYDEARRWAENRCCKVNPKTGVLQVYESRNAEQTFRKKKKTMFSNVSDEELLQLGVPEEQIPFVRTLNDILELYAAANVLPQDAYESLSWIVEGNPKEEILSLTAEWRGDGEIPDGLSEALNIPTSGMYFAVMNSEGDIFRMLSMSRNEYEWSYFLHPGQRQIAEEKYSGSAMVQGEVGTGKTVAALHRTMHLASRKGKERRILFVTFSAINAEKIKKNLQKICTALQFRKIEVVDLNTWIKRFLQKKGCQEEAGNTDMSECIQLLTPSDCYDHVIVDEGEKFSGEALRLIRTLAGEPHSDDIFIVWDSSSRESGIPSVLSENGIQVDSRSSTLKVNFAAMAGWEMSRGNLKERPPCFRKGKKNGKIWWVDLDEHGAMMFSFDRKKIYNYWTDYPWNLTAEEKKIFDEENPFWAEFRSEEKMQNIEKS